MPDINKCVLVTASSKGLGKSIANVFAENGYTIILHGRDINKVKETKQFIQKNKVKTYEVIGDLRDKEVIQSLVDISKNKITVLVNNAAIPCYGLPLEKMNNDKIMESLESNLISAILLTHKIYPLMKEQGFGSIININSIVGKESKKFRSIHSATKWGLKGFSKSLRIEAKENGIKVINVYPTQIKTIKEFTYGFEPDYVAKKIYKEHIEGDTGELVLDGRPEKFRK